MVRGSSKRVRPTPTNLAAVKRLIPLVVVAVAAASCSGGEAQTTTTVVQTVATTTTTTIDVKVCENLADDAVRWVEDLVAELEGIRFEVLTDRTLWPEGLVRIDEEGSALQAESDAAGCDEALIRGAVVEAAARLESDSAASQLLLDLLAPGS